MAPCAARDASEIISLKYPDLSDGLDSREMEVRIVSPHAKELNRVHGTSGMADGALELLYPSMNSANDNLPPGPALDEDVVVSLIPLRSGRMSSALHVRATPSRMGKRSRRAAESKRQRPSKNYLTVSLKHKFSRLCEASGRKRAICLSKYMSLPG